MDILLIWAVIDFASDLFGGVSSAFADTDSPTDTSANVDQPTESDGEWANTDFPEEDTSGDYGNGDYSDNGIDDYDFDGDW